MKLVKIFAGLVVLILVLVFLMQNTKVVSVNLVFAQYENVQVAMIMLGALSVGILIGYGVAVTNILSAKTEIRSLKTKNRRLSDELNDLRNVAIDEGIYMTRMREKTFIELVFTDNPFAHCSGGIYFLFLQAQKTKAYGVHIYPCFECHG